VKLNVGCGSDYRQGFVNIDGSSALPNVDKIIDLSKESLRQYFADKSVEYILANDFIEHHFHWEAVKILNDFYKLLKPGGVLQMRVPDFQRITALWSWRSLLLSPEKKIALLFGGQDLPQGEGDTTSRNEFPQFFCHKYAYTKKTMRSELESIGFTNVKVKSAGTNFEVFAKKAGL